jgi:hypothetical protein
MTDRRTLAQLRRLSVTELSIALAMYELIQEPLAAGRSSLRRAGPDAARHSLANRQPTKPTKESRS